MNDPNCIDLRPWAKLHRYRWRYEESYGAEKPENRADGRWYVEVMCKYGLIYPKGRKHPARLLSPWRQAASRYQHQSGF